MPGQTDYFLHISLRCYLQMLVSKWAEVGTLMYYIKECLKEKHFHNFERLRKIVLSKSIHEYSEGIL